MIMTPEEQMREESLINIISNLAELAKNLQKELGKFEQIVKVSTTNTILLKGEKGDKGDPGGVV